MWSANPPFSSAILSAGAHTVPAPEPEAVKLKVETVHRCCIGDAVPK
jgi:hypothetical protein